MDFDRDAVFRTPEQEPVSAQPGHPAHAAQPGYPAQPGYQAYPDPQAHQPVHPVQPVGTDYGRCVSASVIWIAATLALLVATAGLPASGRGLGEVVGRLILPSLLSAWITWLFVRRKRPHFGLLVLASLPSFIVSFFIFGAVLQAS
ncbi:hypothetical protein [Saccharothrix sp. HUAS TT1]|uniref:hypothetical protein n=1 Tax=unclassified Saccharothrix TaxID=2593673 RepID=UPI00345B71A3